MGVWVVFFVEGKSKSDIVILQETDGYEDFQLLSWTKITEKYVDFDQRN